jgi:hypothetical protein
VSTSSFTPDEIRAAAEVHSELGPDYRDHVVESFLEKVGREIDARVDARVNGARPQPQPHYPPQQQYQPQYAEQQSRQQVAKPPRDHTFALAIVSIALGVPLTAIVLGVGNPSSGAAFAMLLVVWVAIGAINVSYARHKNQ